MARKAARRKGAAKSRGQAASAEGAEGAGAAGAAGVQAQQTGQAGQTGQARLLRQFVRDLSFEAIGEPQANAQIRVALEVRAAERGPAQSRVYESLLSISARGVAPEAEGAHGRRRRLEARARSFSWSCNTPATSPSRPWSATTSAAFFLSKPRGSSSPSPGA